MLLFEWKKVKKFNKYDGNEDFWIKKFAIQLSSMNIFMMGGSKFSLKEKVKKTSLELLLVLYFSKDNTGKYFGVKHIVLFCKNQYSLKSASCTKNKLMSASSISKSSWFPTQIYLLHKLSPTLYQKTLLLIRKFWK